MTEKDLGGIAAVLILIVLLAADAVAALLIP